MSLAFIVFSQKYNSKSCYRSPAVDMIYIITLKFNLSIILFIDCRTADRGSTSVRHFNIYSSAAGLRTAVALHFNT